jgi:hypothetical protein
MDEGFADADTGDRAVAAVVFGAALALVVRLRVVAG